MPWAPEEATSGRWWRLANYRDPLPPIGALWRPAQTGCLQRPPGGKGRARAEGARRCWATNRRVGFRLEAFAQGRLVGFRPSALLCGSLGRAYRETGQRRETHGSRSAATFERPPDQDASEASHAPWNREPE
jgi:hypothetical protein